ncbi:MAG: hypoxanthine phosphoribosyltransferase [Simkaniaceae bacterium]
MKKTLSITPEEIDQKINAFGSYLNQFYKNQPLIIVGILKGSICFIADLIRKLDIPFELEFIQCQSYGDKGMTPGKLTISYLDFLAVKDKPLLLIDDILDTGQTLTQVIQELKKLEPASIKSCVLLKKKNKSPLSVDHVLFEIEDRFVIGYGLDYKEKYRGLKGLYQVE